jgi:hypothetical protein
MSCAIACVSHSNRTCASIRPDHAETCQGQRLCHHLSGVGSATVVDGRGHAVAAGVTQLDVNQTHLLWSTPAIFRLQLLVDESGAITFAPSFDQLERLVQAVLDGAVRTTTDLPRIGAQMVTTATINSAQTIPSMGIDADAVVQVR